MFQFGDSQKLRLVRILRSTVMVRVGGGWTALDEFLVKNDPCRGKAKLTPKIIAGYRASDAITVWLHRKCNLKIIVGRFVGSTCKCAWQFIFVCA